VKQEDVPQDAATLDQWQKVDYAVDDEGRYVLVPTAGWEPSNLANIQAWQLIGEEIEVALQQIRSGAASPLLYHMVHNQMDVALLADYVQLSRWRVKRHLQSKHFATLSAALRERYAAVFKIAVENLDLVPDRVDLPVTVETSIEE